MSVDRMLNRVLGLYRDVHDDATTEQLFATTLTVLTHLTNPLNVTILTSHFLTAPAIWNRGSASASLQASYRIISVYNTAAIHVRRSELERAARKPLPGAGTGGGLKTEAWAKAVAKGADDRSHRWQHLLVLTGILLGLENGEQEQQESALSWGLRNTLEQAVVTAANLALQTSHHDGPVASGSIVLALSYVFPLMSEASRAQVNSDLLLPIAIRSLVGGEGLQDGLFLSAIDGDIIQSGQKFRWPEMSPSFLHMRQLEQKPIVAALGSLSRLLAHAIQHAKDSQLILQAQDDLASFSGKFVEHWQNNRFSELELSEQGLFLTPDTLQGTWSALWAFLKKVMYASVVILQSIVARSLLDPNMRADSVAPTVATKTLHTLRHLYFISSHHGNSAFQVYSFTYLTSIDVLARYPDPCVAFLRDTKPASTGAIPIHPLHRTLDLFYLNTAEHLPLNLPPEACDALIIQPATVYLNPAAQRADGAPLSPRMVELFEAAHSAVLSVLSCPQNAAITVQLAPFYAETLFASFPAHISPRQFRVAFKTLMQIVSPPFPISASHPHLAETLLEMVRFRALATGPAGATGTAPLPPSPADGPLSPGQMAAAGAGGAGPVSEQSVLVLTLIDSLPFLPLPIVEEWMTMTASALNEIAAPALREVAKRRLWEVLVSGEMDVERAAIGVAWWGTKGGRELVLFGANAGQGVGGVAGDGEYVMSGALGPDGSRL